MIDLNTSAPPPAECPVVLLAPPVWTVKTPPLNIATVGAAAAAAGYPVHLIDQNIELYHELAARDPRLIDLWHLSRLSLWYEEDQYRAELAELLQPYMAACAERALAHEPEVVGITLNGLQAALHLAREIRRRDPDVWLVAGGQYAMPLIWGETVTLFGPFQYTVVGEGEQTFLEILEQRRAGLPVEPLPGTIIKEPGGGPLTTWGRARIPDLDALPWPLYEGLDLSRYVFEYEPPPFRPSRAVSVLSTRGCTNRCDFCIQHVVWQDKIQLRSPERVLDEIEHLVARHGIREVNFNDLLVNPSPRHLEGLARAFLDRDLGLRWHGDLTVDPRLDEELAALLKRSGFQSGNFGVESGSTRVLRAMGKRYTPAQAARALEVMRGAGINACVSLVVGHPTEREEDFLRTLDFVCQNIHNVDGPPGVSLCIMFRGSRLWHQMDRYRLEMPLDDAAGWYRRDGTNDFLTRARRARLLRELIRALTSSEAWLANREQVVSSGRSGRWLRDASPAMLLAVAAAEPDPEIGASALRRLARRLKDGRAEGFTLRPFRAALAQALREPDRVAAVQPWVLAELAPSLPTRAQDRSVAIRALVARGRLTLARRLLDACRQPGDPGRAELRGALRRARQERRGPADPV